MKLSVHPFGNKSIPITLTTQNLLKTFPKDWREVLHDYFQSPAWESLLGNLLAELSAHKDQIRPSPEHFFKALEITPISAVKVVIIGQDPYHTPNLAQGMAFSVPANIPLSSRQFPSSLRNISKALSLEGFGNLKNGDLTAWAKQGVLLLNTALSVRIGEAGSHTNLGWNTLVDALIEKISQNKEGVVWVLWGGHAQSKLALIESSEQPNTKHLILQSSHPSGLGVYKTHQPFIHPGGKVSCGHFTLINKWLAERGQKPIVWVTPGSQQKNLFHQD